MILAWLLSTVSLAQDADQDGWDVAAGDCNDFNANIHPDIAEVCDGLDNDCNGVADDTPDAPTWYLDEDGDGVGTEAETLVVCGQQPGWAEFAGDCDDLDDTRTPDQVEWCDGIDNDCNDQVDDNAEDAVVWFLDEDGDGLGDPDTEQHTCAAPPEGAVLNGLDDDDKPLEEGCGCASGPTNAGFLLGLLPVMALRRRR